MKIRFAVLEDIPALVEVGQSIHAQTRFKQFPFRPERVAENLEAVIRDMRGSYCFLVAEDRDGRAVGGLVGSIERHLYADQPVATVVAYTVLPEKRSTGAGLRLMVAFRQWAENRGAFELNAGVSSGVELQRMDKFFRRLGFRFTGGNYSLRLKAAAEETGT
ncbi:MAG: GNAT family N-acetyltransferase [Pseudomonadota bacterium]